MYPEVFHWGVVHLRSYGLLLAVAFLVGTWLSLREAKRLGLDEDKLIGVILAALVTGVLGARLLYVLEHIQDYQRQWSSVFAVWEGGLTLYGGLAAGTVAGLWMARRAHLPAWRSADAIAPAVALGTMFGRIGCFLNGCCYGRPTSLPWGVTYPPDSFPGLEFGSTPIHPAQLYFSIAGLAVFLVLWAVRRRLSVAGHTFWLMIALLGAVRVPLDFTRAYEPGGIVGHLGALALTESQLLSVVMVLFALLMMLRLKRRAAAPQ